MRTVHACVCACKQAYIHTYILSHLHTYVQLVETGNLKWIIGKQFMTMRIGLNRHEMGGGRLILESVFCKATSVHKTHFRWKKSQQTHIILRLILHLQVSTWYWRYILRLMILCLFSLVGHPFKSTWVSLVSVWPKPKPKTNNEIKISQYNVWLQTGWPSFDPRQREKILPLASVSRPALRPYPDSNPMDTGGKAQPGLDADYSLPCSASFLPWRLRGGFYLVHLYSWRFAGKQTIDKTAHVQWRLQIMWFLWKIMYLPLVIVMVAMAQLSQKVDSCGFTNDSSVVFMLLIP
jgi:hypothetical protein